MRACTPAAKKCNSTARQVLAGLIGMVVVAAMIIIPSAVSITLAYNTAGVFDRSSITSIGTGLVLYAFVLTVSHALLRALCVVRPLLTLLLGGVVTVLLGGMYLVMLSWIAPEHASSSALWPVFATAFLVFFAGARWCPEKEHRA